MAKYGDKSGALRFYGDRGWRADPSIVLQDEAISNPAHGIQESWGTYPLTTGSTAPQAAETVAGLPAWTITDDATGKEGFGLRISQEVLDNARGRTLPIYIFIERKTEHAKRRGNVGEFERPTCNIDITFNHTIEPTKLGPVAGECETHIDFPLASGAVSADMAGPDALDLIQVEGPHVSAELQISSAMTDALVVHVEVPVAPVNGFVLFTPATGSLFFDETGAVTQRNTSAFSAITYGIIRASAVCFGEPIGEKLSDSFLAEVTDSDTQGVLSSGIKTYVDDKLKVIDELKIEIANAEDRRKQTAAERLSFLVDWLATLSDVADIEQAGPPTDTGDEVIGDVWLQKLESGKYSIFVYRQLTPENSGWDSLTDLTVNDIQVGWDYVSEWARGLAAAGGAVDISDQLNIFKDEIALTMNDMQAQMDLLAAEQARLEALKNTTPRTVYLDTAASYFDQSYGDKTNLRTDLGQRTDYHTLTGPDGGTVSTWPSSFETIQLSASEPKLVTGIRFTISGSKSRFVQITTDQGVRTLSSNNGVHEVAVNAVLYSISLSVTNGPGTAAIGNVSLREPDNSTIEQTVYQNITTGRIVDENGDGFNLPYNGRMVASEDPMIAIRERLDAHDEQLLQQAATDGQLATEITNQFQQIIGNDADILKLQDDTGIPDEITLPVWSTIDEDGVKTERLITFKAVEIDPYVDEDGFERDVELQFLAPKAIPATTEQFLPADTASLPLGVPFTFTVLTDQSRDAHQVHITYSRVGDAAHDPISREMIQATTEEGPAPAFHDSFTPFAVGQMRVRVDILYDSGESVEQLYDLIEVVANV